MSFSNKWNVTSAAGCARPIGRVQRASWSDGALSGKVAASSSAMNPATDKLELLNLAHRYIRLRTYRMWSHKDGYNVRDITSQHVPANAWPGLAATCRFPASRRRCHDVA